MVCECKLVFTVVCVIEKFEDIGVMVVFEDDLEVEPKCSEVMYLEVEGGNPRLVDDDEYKVKLEVVNVVVAVVSVVEVIVFEACVVVFISRVVEFENCVVVFEAFVVVFDRCDVVL